MYGIFKFKALKNFKDHFNILDKSFFWESPEEVNEYFNNLENNINFESRSENYYEKEESNFETVNSDNQCEEAIRISTNTIDNTSEVYKPRDIPESSEEYNSEEIKISDKNSEIDDLVKKIKESQEFQFNSNSIDNLSKDEEIENNRNNHFLKESLSKINEESQNEDISQTISKTGSNNLFARSSKKKNFSLETHNKDLSNFNKKPFVNNDFDSNFESNNIPLQENTQQIYFLNNHDKNKLFCNSEENKKNNMSRKSMDHLPIQKSSKRNIINQMSRSLDMSGNKQSSYYEDNTEKENKQMEIVKISSNFSNEWSSGVFNEYLKSDEDDSEVNRFIEERRKLIMNDEESDKLLKVNSNEILTQKNDNSHQTNLYIQSNSFELETGRMSQNNNKKNKISNQVSLNDNTISSPKSSPSNQISSKENNLKQISENFSEKGENSEKSNKEVFIRIKRLSKKSSIRENLNIEEVDINITHPLKENIEENVEKEKSPSCKFQIENIIIYQHSKRDIKSEKLINSSRRLLQSK